MQPQHTHHRRQLRQRSLRPGLAGGAVALLTLLTSVSYGWGQPRRALIMGGRPGATHDLAQSSSPRRLPGRVTVDNANARKDLFVGKCVAVLDGDTILVEHDDHTDKVDLWGIDCPEIGQPYGQQARQFTANRVLGQTVRVRVKGHHKGRVLACVDSGPGSTLNEEVVGGGLGWFYPKQAGDTFLIPLLQDTARQDKRGLWADKDPISPWQWRKSH